MGNALPCTKLVGSDMLGVTVGDGVVNRLCCARVVVEEIKGPTRIRVAVESVVGVLLCDLRRKVGDIVSFRHVKISAGCRNLYETCIGTHIGTTKQRNRLLYQRGTHSCGMAVRELCGSCTEVVREL